MVKLLQGRLFKQRNIYYKGEMDMALEMRNKCEKCMDKLTSVSIAYICVHECTFCPDCTKNMNYICPHCGGELVKRSRKGLIANSCSL
jgi:uncharacterized protein